MFEDLTKEIRAQLYERAKSPLFGAFALAWLAWNFWAVAALFSDMTFAQKVVYWNQLYPTGLEQAFKVFVGPLVSAALFILAYPIPARWAFRYWFGQHTKLKAIQQHIEDETPLTQEEANDLRKSLLEKELVWQKQLSEASKANAELRQQIDQLMTELGDARQEIAKNLGSPRDRSDGSNTLDPLDGILSPVSASPLALDDKEPRHPSKSRSFFDATVPVTAESIIASLPETTKKQLVEAFHASDDRVLASFLALVRQSGHLSKSGLATFPDLSPIDMRYAFPLLMSEGLVTETTNSYALTDVGNALASTSGLTKLVPRIN